MNDFIIAVRGWPALAFGVIGVVLIAVILMPKGGRHESDNGDGAVVFLAVAVVAVLSAGFGLYWFFTE